MKRTVSVIFIGIGLAGMTEDVKLVRTIGALIFCFALFSYIDARFEEIE